MKTTYKFMLLAAGLAGAFGGYTFHQEHSAHYNSITGEASATPVIRAAYTGVSAPPADFEKAADNAVPSVVHIKTLTKFKQVRGGSRQQQSPFGDMFGDDFFKQFFGEDGRAYQQPDQRASGSGVIISADGYIVTNNHVVDGANDISVTLSDRKTYTAKVIGTDVNTDLALIKVEGKNLPVMPIGNSDDVHLGQWVLAVGYPLNLDVTVTQGIVSAKSRNIGINTKGTAPVEAFIQTDAAVNPGSSGGALVNTSGELVGITAAIASPTGSYAGYAYSIPSNLVKKVMSDIMKYGTVQRGYLGISMAPDELDDKQKKELGINDNIDGVWVIETDPKGAAAEAGIQKGDVITKVDGIAINTDAELSEQMARHKPGDIISMTFVRNSTEKTVKITLKNKPGSFASQSAAAVEALGIQLSALDQAEAAKLGIAGGVQVTAIGDGVISNETNMRQGFVITKIGGIPVKTVDELKDAISKQEANFQIEGIYPGSKQVYYYGINDFGK
jgi:Do/DeqQ family serine protease